MFGVKLAARTERSMSGAERGGAVSRSSDLSRKSNHLNREPFRRHGVGAINLSPEVGSRQAVPSVARIPFLRNSALRVCG